MEGRKRDEFLWHSQPHAHTATHTSTHTCNTEDHTMKHHPRGHFPLPPFPPPPPIPPTVHSPQPLNQPSSFETRSQHGSNGSDVPFAVSNPNTGVREHILSKRTHSLSLLAVSTPKPLPTFQGRSLIPKLDEAVPAARRNLTLEEDTCVSYEEDTCVSFEEPHVATLLWRHESVRVCVCVCVCACMMSGCTKETDLSMYPCMYVCMYVCMYPQTDVSRTRCQVCTHSCM